MDPLQYYTERELRSRYRFGREGIEFIVDLLADEISPATRRSHSLSAKEQILITLRFVASGSFLEVIGDTFGSYDKSTVSRVVRRVTQALAAKVNDFHQVSRNKSRARRNQTGHVQNWWLPMYDRLYRWHARENKITVTERARLCKQKGLSFHKCAGYL